MNNLTDTLELLYQNSTLVQKLPPEITGILGDFIVILKAAGIVFIGYILFLIIKGVLDLRRSIRIDRMIKKVDDIDGKLDLLLKKGKETKNSKEEVKKVKKK